MPAPYLYMQCPLCQGKLSFHFPAFENQQLINRAYPRKLGRHGFYALIARKCLSTKQEMSIWQSLKKHGTLTHYPHGALVPRRPFFIA
jgi:hypothetical protein